MEWDDCGIVLSVLLLLRDSMGSSPTIADSHPAADRRSLLDRAGESPWLFPMVLMATVAVLFAGSVGPGIVFAFRDSLHFYPPLYRLVADEWLAGRVPLWNPLLNCGQPLAGMGSAGAFYPPQVLIAMLLPDGTSLNVSCILHLALAATGAYLLAWDQGCSRPAATVAGLAYAFGGSVLLQVYNPIYAAGAAWLAWAMYAGLRLVQDRGGPRDFVLLAAALAMCVFCGDPQAAYHAGLVLGLFWLMLPGRSWRGFGLLAAAGLAGGLLSLVQVALAAEFTRDTQRSMDLAPYSLWEIPTYLAHRAEIGDRADWYDIFIGRPRAAAGHYGAIYAFALHPLRLLEFIWPDALGTIAGRWAADVGLDNGEVWANSLYSGILPLAVAAAAWVVPSTRWPTRRVWGLAAALALVASMGGLGLVGLVRNAAVILTSNMGSLGYAHGDEVGGLYWALSIALPGYAGFRYPVKWMTVFALALGQLAAMGFDGLGEPRVRARARAIAAAIAGLIGAVVVVLAVVAVMKGTANVLPGGSVEARRAAVFSAVMWGGVHAVLFAIATSLLLRERCFTIGRFAASMPALLTVVLAADLALAGRREMCVERLDTLLAGSQMLETLEEQRVPHLAALAPRMRIAVVDPESLLIDPLDLNRYVREIGESLVGHGPWLRTCEKIGERSTAMPQDIEALICPLRLGDAEIMPRRTFDLCGVEYFAIGAGEPELRGSVALLEDWSAEQKAGGYVGPAPRGEPLPIVNAPRQPDGGPPLMVMVRNLSALPRARIVRQAAVVPAVGKRDWGPWIDLLKRIAFPNPAVPDLVHGVLVEGTTADAMFSKVQRGSVPSADACRLVSDAPDRVVLVADLVSPGLVVLADSWHPDWKVSVSTDGGPARAEPIRRANRIHRAVSLPAGRHVLEFRHHSRTFAWTWPVTLAAWVVAGGVVAGSLVRRATS